VLAYNSVLNFGGHALSREVLLKCMDLAAKVAEEGSDLGECFRAAGRMSELMHSMATASKSIMRAEEAGQKLGKKVKARKLKGENLQIWSVRSS
jgi:nuclear pore complex protein Nup107